MIKQTLSLLLVSLLGSTLQAETLTYTLDPVHSGVEFKIRHFINKMPGAFSDFNGTIHYDAESPENSKVEATIQITSVDTRNTDRDEHLQNEDFFQTAKFPLMTFTSTDWEETGGNTYKVTGDLSFAGKTNSIVLDVTYLGEMEGNGLIRSGWEGSATIDRSDWGMTYGYPQVGKEVDIELNIQAHRKPTAE